MPRSQLSHPSKCRRLLSGTLDKLRACCEVEPIARVWPLPPLGLRSLVPDPLRLRLAAVPALRWLLLGSILELLLNTVDLQAPHKAQRHISQAVCAAVTASRLRHIVRRTLRIRPTIMRDEPHQLLPRALSPLSRSSDSRFVLPALEVWNCSSVARWTCTVEVLVMAMAPLLVAGVMADLCRNMVEMPMLLLQSAALEVVLLLLLSQEESSVVMAVPSFISVSIGSSFTPIVDLLLTIFNSTARAMYSYTAAIPEELGFTKGDVLSVIRLQDDGWWEAEVTNSRGHPGLVPSNYLQII